MQSPPRTTVLVTHPTAENDAFAVRLSSKVALAGHRLVVHCYCLLLGFEMPGPCGPGRSAAAQKGSSRSSMGPLLAQRISVSDQPSGQE